MTYVQRISPHQNAGGGNILPPSHLTKKESNTMQDNEFTCENRANGCECELCWKQASDAQYAKFWDERLLDPCTQCAAHWERGLDIICTHGPIITQNTK